jgi:hypothetical protein
MSNQNGTLCPLTNQKGTFLNVKRILLVQKGVSPYHYITNTGLLEKHIYLLLNKQKILCNISWEWVKGKGTHPLRIKCPHQEGMSPLEGRGGLLWTYMN